MMDCLYAKYCVMAELEKLGQKYRAALRIAKDHRFERLPCIHKGTFADDCIVERVSQAGTLCLHKCFIVATCDKDLKRRIRKVPGVPIMYITQHKYSIERLPEATIGGGDLFGYFEGNHDVYFSDDMAAELCCPYEPVLILSIVCFSLFDQMKPLNHSHDLPPPGNKGRTYACSCMIFLRRTDGAKLTLVILSAGGSSSASPDNIPNGRIILQEPNMGAANQGNAVIIHNNYITGFKKKIERFRDYGLRLVDDRALGTPLGRL
ncbi:hypothetical protein V6N12_022492 [Hibiscus sabdariffa]|uniref:PIN domain-like family protein n=1 Tax=Hibiscus sabdariffa TaxID=183260 RepID=A0ABR2FUV3_9ROSI